MSKSVWLLIGSFLLFLFVAALTLQSMVILQRIASVSDAQGDVRIKHHSSDAFNPLGSARYVRAGDVMQTGDGSLTLNWVDGARVKVGSHTTLEILKCQINSATKADVSVFKLDVGQVWVRVRKLLSPRSKFEVLTPTATAGVRGTMFSVKVDPRGATQVSVLEGQVVLAEKDSDATIAVDQDHCGQVEKTPAPGSQPLAVATMTDAERAEWKTAAGIEGPFVCLTRPAYATSHLNETGCCRVAGLAEETAKVTVNGLAAQRGTEGHFSADVPAQAGKPLQIEVVAEDARGIRTVLTRQVTITTSTPTP
jgi:hypothetical protein